MTLLKQFNFIKPYFLTYLQRLNQLIKMMQVDKTRQIINWNSRSTLQHETAPHHTGRWVRSASEDPSTGSTYCLTDCCLVLLICSPRSMCLRHLKHIWRSYSTQLVNFSSNASKKQFSVELLEFYAWTASKQFSSESSFLQNVLSDV